MDRHAGRAGQRRRPGAGDRISAKQGYQEGAFVRKGQLLFQIDPRPFQAALDQAEGQLAQAKAQLANAEAVQGRTELDVKRYTPLAEEQAATQQDLDNAVQNNLRP